MLGLNGLRCLPIRIPFAHIPDFLAGFLGGLYRVYEGQGVMFVHNRGGFIPCPGMMDICRWNYSQFWYPLPDKMTVWILIHSLFHGVIDPDRIYAGCPRLHLHLRPVNARLIIDEQPGQMMSRLAPIQPQMVTGHGHQHCPHAEIHPTGGVQAAHAGIDKWQSGFAPFPCPQSVRIRRAGSDPPIGGVLFVKL